jgi:hypothetical protein
MAASCDDPRTAQGGFDEAGGVDRTVRLRKAEPVLTITAGTREALQSRRHVRK